jgi:hypothetical protein
MTQLPKTIPWKIIAQRHPAYSPGVWRELDDLYEGGYAIRGKQQYLPRLVAEHDRDYESRLGAAGYINFLGETIGHFSGRLFENAVLVIPAADAGDTTTLGGYPDTVFWPDFANNADGAGTTFIDLLKAAFDGAALKGRALVAVDLPRLASAPANKAEETASQANRATAFVVPIEQLINWRIAKNGTYEFAIFERCDDEQKDPLQVQGSKVYEWKIWTLEDGRARWDLYRSAVIPPGHSLDESKSVDWVDGGTTDFEIVPLFMLDFGSRLWLGNKIGTLCLEHYQRRSALVSAGNKSCVVIPTIFLGSEIPTAGAGIASVQEDPSRGENPKKQFERKGYVVLGAGDRFEMMAHDAAPYKFSSSELTRLRDDIYRTVAHMGASADNSAGNARQSGDAKKQDKHPETKLLYAFAGKLIDFAIRVCDFIAAARGEDVIWTVHGLDDFEEVDRQVVILEAAGMSAVQIHSPTFKKAYELETAKKLLGPLDASTVNTIQREIDRGVDEAQEASELKEPEPESEEEPHGTD